MVQAIILAAYIVEGLVVVAFIVITIAEVISWFKARSSLLSSDRDNIAFTLANKIESGDYEVVQGIFDQGKRELLDARKMKGKMDEELTQRHKASPLVLYPY